MFNLNIRKFKIISGGQTGIDRAALDAAIEMKIPHGGWCPPNRESEDGPIPLNYNLCETPQDRSREAPSIARSLRTEWNVRDSDGTLILSIQIPPLDKGTVFTSHIASSLKKPLLIVNLSNNELGKIKNWITFNKIFTLNIAGPSENTSPGIYEIAIPFIKEIIRKLN